MADEVYGTSTVLDVMRFQKVNKPFWLQFFNRTITFDTPEIFFDRVNQDYRRLAPFVVPNVQGRVMGLGSYDSVSFRPAYVKPKHVIDPNMVIERQAGEQLAVGSLTLGQRRNAVIGEISRQHREMLQNRNEWLAAKALIDGSVTIADEDYPSTTVDFRRHASLSYALTGTARWSQSAGDPLADLKAARQNVYNRSGARVTKHVFGATAWDYFNDRVDVKELMNRNYGGLETQVTRMDDGYEGQEYMGTIAGLRGAGRIEVWVDTSKYVDDDGNEQFYLDQNTVVGVGESVEGVRCFGAIKDFDAGPTGLAAMEVFTKMWRNQDPSVEYLLSQSAPLMVPKRPNATFKILVHQ